MKMSKQYKWHQYFMTMAYLVATKSKDPSSKVGSVIVGENFEIISTGYNGLPRGVEDTDLRYEKPLKYELMNHAEENAILNCCRIGISTKNCSIYVPWIPCSLCAKSIIQAGIKQVIYHKEWPGNSKIDSNWMKSIGFSKEMFTETNIELIEFSGPMINIKGYYDEKEFEIIS
jgi:dCMP deaminase